jgi:hypothetical protein
VLGADRARACVLAGTGSPQDEGLLWQAGLAHLPRGTMRLGPDAGTDLTVTAIAEAAVLITDDPAAALVGRAYGVPVVAVAPGDEPGDAIRRALTGPTADLGPAVADVAALDAMLDRLAADARRAAAAHVAQAPAARSDAGLAPADLARIAGEARARRLMGELARERERAAALQHRLDDQATMLHHVQGAYDTLSAHVQVAQIRAEQAEARLDAAQHAGARALAATEANAQHTIGALEAQLKHYVNTVTAMEGQIAALTGDRDAALAAAAAQAEAAEANHARAEALAAELEQARRDLETIINSRSWRALAPARSAGEVIRRLSE